MLKVRKSVSAEVNYGIRFVVESEFDAFLQQLCTEVHSRLTEIRHRGKTVTLKLMVRSADAPIETAKFMGHGVCDNLTKTSTLNEYTCDAEVIRKTVFALKSSMAVDPKELRGVGIQIGKLDSGNEGVQKPGRLKAMFEVAAQKKIVTPKFETSDVCFETNNPERRTSRNQRTIEPKLETVPVVVNKAKRGRKRGSGGASTSRSIGRGSTKQPSVTDLLAIDPTVANDDDSNPNNQLDMAVLAELPDSIREEALRDFRLQQQTAKRQKIIKAQPIPVGVSVEGTSDELDPDFLAALPEDIRTELVRERAVRKQREQRQQEESIYADKVQQPTIEPVETKPFPDEPKVTTSAGNVFTSDDWQDRLKAWVDSSNDTDIGPLESDVETIAEYAAELARLRMINDLYLRFRYFFRYYLGYLCFI